MRTFNLDDFKKEFNPEIAKATGKANYILISDLRPLLWLVKEPVTLEFKDFKVEKPLVSHHLISDSFFTQLFSCPQKENPSCTCCKGILGFGAFDAGVPGTLERIVNVNGTPHNFRVLRGDCPLFTSGRCSLGGSSREFYSNVPLPCAISPSWDVSFKGSRTSLGRKICKPGAKIGYSKERLDLDLLVLSRIERFLSSLSLETRSIKELKDSLISSASGFLNSPHKKA